MIGQSHSCAIESTVAQSFSFVSRFFFLGKAVDGALLALFIFSFFQSSETSKKCLPNSPLSL